MYIPSSMLWKGSDLIVAAGKSTEEHFAQKGLNDGVKGFLAQIKGNGIGYGLEEYGISTCEIPRPGGLCTNTGLFVCLIDGYRVAME